MPSAITVGGLCFATLLCVAPMSSQLDTSAQREAPAQAAVGPTRFDCLLTLIDELSGCRRLHCKTQSLFWFTWEVCDQLALVNCVKEAEQRFQECLEATTP